MSSGLPELGVEDFSLITESLHYNLGAWIEKCKLFPGINGLMKSNM